VTQGDRNVEGKEAWGLIDSALCDASSSILRAAREQIESAAEHLPAHFAAA